MLLFIDNIFRFTQAGSEVSALLGRMPSAVGYQPTLATEMGELQERITSTKQGLDHLGAGHLRAGRRPHRPGAGRRRSPTSTRPPCSSRAIAEKGIYPAVDPLDSTSPHPRAAASSASEHYHVARARAARSCSATRTCRTSSRSSAWTSSPKTTSSSCRRARKIERFLSQPFFVAEQFTGTPGKYVKLEDTIRGFKEILEGKHDDLPEQAFYMQGGIDEVVAAAEKMKAGV